MDCKYWITRNLKTDYIYRELKIQFIRRVRLSRRRRSRFIDAYKYLFLDLTYKTTIIRLY